MTAWPAAQFAGAMYARTARGQSLRVGALLDNFISHRSRFVALLVSACSLLLTVGVVSVSHLGAPSGLFRYLMPTLPHKTC